jgi:hypothetical protein
MREAIGRAVEGRAALVVGVVALVAALSGSAIALPGQNSVDSGDIKNGQVSVKDMKIAYLYVDDDGDVVKQKGVQSFDFPVGNVICVNLKFKPKTANATRGVATGGDFTAPQIGIPPEPGLVGCDAPFKDGIVQVPGEPDLNSTYAEFFG